MEQLLIQPKNWCLRLMDPVLFLLVDISKNKAALLATVPSKKSARTIAIDAKSHKIYLPAADMEPVPADAPKGTRPKMIPGSFQILVFEQ